MSRKNKKGNRKTKVAEGTTKTMREKFYHVNEVPHAVAKNHNQSLHIEALEDADKRVIIATGFAGTGKTYLSCHKAAQLLSKGLSTRYI